MLVTIEPEAERFHHYNLREQESHSSFTDISLPALTARRPLPRRAAWRQCFPQDAVQVFGRAVAIRFETLLIQREQSSNPTDAPEASATGDNGEQEQTSKDPFRSPDGEIGEPGRST